MTGRILAVFSGWKPSGGGKLGFCPALRVNTDVPEEHAQCIQLSVIETLGFGHLQRERHLHRTELYLHHNQLQLQVHQNHHQQKIIL